MTAIVEVAVVVVVVAVVVEAVVVVAVVDVDDGELDNFTKLGWRFVSIVNARKAVVRWERKSDPVYPITPHPILDEDSKTGVASHQ